MFNQECWLGLLLPGALVDISAGSGQLMESLKQGDSKKGPFVMRGWFMWICSVQYTLLLIHSYTQPTTLQLTSAVTQKEQHKF
jgi:hypothetical protein